jgi:hypothetical protein
VKESALRYEGLRFGQVASASGVSMRAPNTCEGCHSVPVRIDDAVFPTNEAWALTLRASVYQPP